MADETEILPVIAPVLEQTWQFAPAFELGGDVGGQGADMRPPQTSTITVDVDSITSVVNLVLKSTQPAVDDYTDLWNHLHLFGPDGAPPLIDWVFSVTSADQIPADGHIVPVPETPQEAWFRENSANFTPGSSSFQGKGNVPRSDKYIGMSQAEVDLMKTYIDNCLLTVADSVHLTGQFVSMVHYAAEAYAKADQESVMPEPDRQVSGA